jgi:hypothetical protein
VSELVSQYRAGATVYELAQKFSIHRVTVSKLLRGEGVRLRLDGLSEAAITQAAELYSGGWSLARIGDHFGVAGSTVFRAFKGRGLPTRSLRQKSEAYNVHPRIVLDLPAP